MKNFIKSKYNLNPLKIYKKNNYYFFFSNNDKIYIIKSQKSKDYLDKLVKISNDLYNNGILISTFIINNNGEYYTKKGNEYIVLLKYNDISANDITLNDLNKYFAINHRDLESNNLAKEWENTIDTIENEMSEYNKEYSLVQESLNYFVGISENAIQMIKEVNFSTNNISHKININNFNRFELNNPFNLINSNKMYDISNYIKYNFYNYTIDYNELHEIINKSSKDDIVVLFCLLLYQEEYFEIVKKILLGKTDEKELNKYINRVNDYKSLLRYIKNSLHNVSIFNGLEWIDK